jgi:Tfp pilus assembly protein PilF
MMQMALKTGRQTGWLNTKLLLCCAVLLSSCARQPVTANNAPILPATSEHWFTPTAGQKVQLPATSDFYRLTAAQQQHFLAFFNAPAQQELAPHQRLYRYLEHHLVNFNYEGKNTMASITMANMTGNCVSLALLVTALAQLVDIDVGYRASYAEPVLDISANIVLSSAHVRSYLFEQNPLKDEGVMKFQRASVAVDYFPGRLDRLGAKLDNRHFEAMIYNNLAADAFLAGDLNQAYWLSRAALRQDPHYSASINLIAILYRRQGDLLAAQQWYEFGMRYSSQPVTLASNYLVLAAQMQNQPLIDKLNNQLRLADDDNPYVWFYLAYQAERDNKTADAVYYYEKLLKKAPYLHKANLALAKLQFQLGQPESARRALHEALQYSYDPANRQMYQAKLHALEQMAME